MTEYQKNLGLKESTAIVISRIIGSGIFRTPAPIMALVGCTSLFGLVWVLGGIITIFGAVVYAELTAMIPKSGGPYVFLKEAYGPYIAFLRGWAMFFVSETASIVAVALVFTEFINAIFEIITGSAFGLLPTFLLSNFTNQQVKVSLCGDGADEIFAGYPTYLAHKITSVIPRQLHDLINKISFLLPVKHRNMSFDFKLRQFSRGLRYERQERHQYWLGSFKNNEKQKNYIKHFKDTLSNKNNLTKIIKQNFNELKDWEINLEQDFNFYLTDDMLVKIDRTSMANSLEVRVPYLDHNIVEFMVKCPSKLKYRGLTSKYLLKQLAKKYLPKKVVNRSKKGFGIPIAKWFCGSLKKPLEEIIRDPNSYVNTIFEKSYTNYLMENHLQKKQNNGKMLWTLFTLENWYNNNGYSDKKL